MSLSFLVDKNQSGAGTEAPAYVVQFEDTVHKVEFSPYVWSHNLILVAFPTKIIVASVRLDETKQECPGMEFTKVQEFPCLKRVDAICWSPKTNVNIAPKCICFAYSLPDNSIVVCTSNTWDTGDQQIVKGHTNYVNDLAFHPNDNLLASVSDDHTCRVWSGDDYQLKLKFYLKGPGVAVKWHHDQRNKLLVADKMGTIVFYNVTDEIAVFSLTCQWKPLLSLDWSPVDSSLVAAACGSRLVVWDVNNRSAPHSDRIIHNDGVLHVKFSPAADHKILSMGVTDKTIKMSTLNRPFPQPLATLKYATTGLTCHQNMPYVGLGVDCNIFIWEVANSSL